MTYVIYRLFPESLLTSVAITAMLLNMDLKPNEHYHSVLNLLIAMVLSIVAAGAYWLSADVIGTLKHQLSNFISSLVN